MPLTESLTSICRFACVALLIKSSSYAYGLIGITVTYLFWTKSHNGWHNSRPGNSSPIEFYALMNDAFSLSVIGMSVCLKRLPPIST